jgi:hypothetical protein
MVNLLKITMSAGKGAYPIGIPKEKQLYHQVQLNISTPLFGIERWLDLSGYGPCSQDCLFPGKKDHNGRIVNHTGTMQMNLKGGQPRRRVTWH